MSLSHALRRVRILVVLAGALATAEPPASIAAEEPGEEVRRLLEAATDADARERVRRLEAALEHLDALEDVPADLDRSAIEAALARARTAPVLALDCARAGDHACLLERAGALIDEHHLDDRRAALGREQARTDPARAEATAGALDQAGDRLGASEVVSAIATQHVAAGERERARALIDRRIDRLLEVPPPERVHRLLTFGVNLVGDGLTDLAAPAFQAAERESASAIEAVPPSAAAEAVLVMYRAQALAGLGASERALDLMAGLAQGPLTAGRVVLARLLARLGEPGPVERIAAHFEDDWRINTARVEAAARAGNYRTAVDLARAAARASNRWLRLRAAAEAMVARGDGEPAGKVLAALERAATPSQVLGLAALWRELGGEQEAARLRERFIEALAKSAGERLEQPVASAEEADAVAGWILELARSLPAG